MLLLKRLFFIALLLAMIALGIFFSMSNTETIQLTVSGYSAPPVSSGLAILIALTFGSILGLFAGFGAQLALWRKYRKSEKQLRIANEELQKLRLTAVRD